MARITCNFYSYSVGYPIDIQIILPSLSPCDGDVMPELTHKITEKYPVIYFLHGHGMITFAGAVLLPSSVMWRSGGSQPSSVPSETRRT